MSQPTQSLSKTSALSLKVSKAKQALDVAQQSGQAAKDAKDALVVTLGDYRAAMEIVQSVGEDCQRRCQEQIAYVVTRCLRAVFGEDSYEFQLVFENKRNQTEVRAVLVDKDKNTYDIHDSNGGGVLDIASFGLRLACMMLRRPKPAKVLVLDEPMKMLSKNHHANAMRMMTELAREFGVQIIMVTHADVFADMADTVIRIDRGR